MNSIKNRSISFSVVLIFMIASTIRASSDQSIEDQKFTSAKSNYITVISIGTSPIKKNRSSAKQNATNEALKDAVERSVIRMMSRVEITSNLKLIYDAVHNHAEKFIVSYRVLDTVTQKESTMVAVESQINIEALRHFFNRKGSINSSFNMAEAGMDEIKSLSSEKGSGFKTIKAEIEGSDYLSSFIMLRKTLNSMNGIKDVQTRELTSDQAVVIIAFDGDGNDLARELMLNSFDDFVLELSAITAESLTIRFVPKANGSPIKKTDMKDAYISE